MTMIDFLSKVELTSRLQLSHDQMKMRLIEYEIKHPSINTEAQRVDLRHFQQAIDTIHIMYEESCLNTLKTIKRENDLLNYLEAKP